MSFFTKKTNNSITISYNNDLKIKVYGFYQGDNPKSDSIICEFTYERKRNPFSLIIKKDLDDLKESIGDGSLKKAFMISVQKYFYEEYWNSYSDQFDQLMDKLTQALKDYPKYFELL